MPQAPPIPPVPATPDRTDDDIDQADLERKVRRACIVMFYLFVITIGGLIMAISVGAMGELGFGVGMGPEGDSPTWAKVLLVAPYLLSSWALFIGGIYSLFCVPRRWRIIMSLSPRYRVRGKVGGIGLIVMFAVVIVGGALQSCAKRQQPPEQSGLSRPIRPEPRAISTAVSHTMRRATLSRPCGSLPP